jgi:hypothetical protein
MMSLMVGFRHSDQLKARMRAQYHNHMYENGIAVSSGGCNSAEAAAPPERHVIVN